MKEDNYKFYCKQCGYDNIYISCAFCIDVKREIQKKYETDYFRMYEK